MQEQVLVSGGPDWETLAAAQPDHRDALARGRVRLPSLPNVPGQAPAARGATPPAEAPRRWRSLRWGVGLAATAAAALLLAANDRAWLVERRRAWVAKLDAHLASLESGQPAATIRDQADATIHALIAVLRERAKPMS